MKLHGPSPSQPVVASPVRSHLPSDSTDRAYHLKNMKQTAKAQILANGHPQFNNLRIAELCPQAPKELITY
jgi:hypothetical protein